MNFKNRAKDCFEKAKELFDDNTRLKNLYHCYPIYKPDVEFAIKDKDKNFAEQGINKITKLVLY